MPIYEYYCTKCHGEFEIIQAFSDKPLKKCEKCGGKLQKLVSKSSFHLKGTGWYVTDYASSPHPGSKPAESGECKTDSASDSKSGSDSNNGSKSKSSSDSKTKSDSKKSKSAPKKSKSQPAAK